MTEQSAAPEVKWGEWIGGGWLGSRGPLQKITAA